MTPELHERWTQDRPPFDGLTLSMGDDDLVPLATLREGLRCLVERLQGLEVEGPLYTAADWHEHDGYISEARATTWEDVHSWLESDDALYAAGQGDTYVRTAVLPQSAEFYLRFYVPADSDNDYPERRGSFDLTCQDEVARSLAATLERSAGLRVSCEPAKQFFDRRYGG